MARRPVTAGERKSPPTDDHPFSLHGASVAVLGGSSGIGRCVAEQAARLGARVFIGARSAKKIDCAISEIGQNIKGQSVDVADATSLRRFFEFTGPVDHLCWSVAAKTDHRRIAGDDLSALKTDWDKLFWALVEAVQLALPGIGATGSVTAVTGSLRLRPVAGKSMLTASQQAIEGLFRALAVEHAPVRFNIVAPGVIDTALWTQMEKNERAAFFRRHAEKIPAKTIGAPQSISSLIISAMVNPFMTGSVLTADGGEALV